MMKDWNDAKSKAGVAKTVCDVEAERTRTSYHVRRRCLLKWRQVVLVLTNFNAVSFVG
jgi:hypothetical protein